ncbi:S1 family peptidase [Streptosporangium carneum]|uniref:Peptidase S1 domain-containing protein n=1 Tax=Streptosporangium carneum TaxID=47481 RepID=A0A9W6MD85_9ACTN|nr:S1 family peptidase [Streptosporangium carneum]GLK09822.1 hypothetical protein GCM10017600_32280 [Streptosporangium carneum]
MTKRISLLLIIGFLLLDSGAAAAGTARLQSYVIRGGDSFFTTTGRCTVGVAVRGGYVTAGACGRVGEAVRGRNQTAQGAIRASSFPSASMAWVEVNPDWVPRGAVNGVGGEIAVRGGSPAPVGSSVCRSGGTSGWHCGILLRRNASVTYPQGTLHGLIEASVCAEPGDLGAPLMSAGHVQGVLVGSTGNCSTGGRSYYQPIDEILQRYGLTLLTL